MKKIILSILLFLIIGIIPSLADGICRNDEINEITSNICVNFFELPLVPILFFSDKVLGFRGEQNLSAIILAPLLYIIIGAIIGLILEKISKRKRK